MDYLVIAAFWAFCGWILIRRKTVLAFAAAYVAVPFGSLATIPTGFTGGLTILPAPALTAIAVALFLSRKPGRDFLAENVFSARRLGILTLFLGIAVFSAFLYPRIFQGATEVVPVRSPEPAFGGSWQILRPTTQNVSQLMYLLLSIALVYCLTFLIQVRRYQQVLLSGLLIGGAVSLATGALDLASQYVDISFLLAPFRTGSYSLLVSDAIQGSKRVVGLMPEASSYGPMCVIQGAMIYFWRPAIAHAAVRERYALWLSVALFVFGFLSTSSAAYLALFVTGLSIMVHDLAGRLRHGPSDLRPRLPWRTFLAAGLVLALIVALLTPSVFAPFIRLIDAMVFGKSTSSSFEERMAWNAVSMAALWDTYGIGVGVGSTRASSWFVALVASTGVPGALVFAFFVGQILLRRKWYRTAADAVLVRGGRWLLLPVFSAGALTATAPDFGRFAALALATQAAFLYAQVARSRTGAVASATGASGPAVETGRASPRSVLR